MTVQGRGLRALGAAIVLAGWGLLAQAQVPQRQPVRDAGNSVTGAFEGWFRYPDGAFGLLLGYYNRNSKQELDIPIGPNNRIEPGGPDQGQPTHFLTGRQWGMFAIKVPKDFGNTKITWTIVVNGITSTIPASLHPDYEISPFVSTVSAVGSPGEGDTAPILKFEKQGPSVQGPLGLTTEKTATVSNPLTLTVWVADDGRFLSNSGLITSAMRNRLPVSVRFTTYRGPGTVTFAKVRPDVQKSPECLEKSMVFCGSTTTTATFSQPGDYMVHVLVNDYSGEGGGFGGTYCCWTNGFVKVAVKP